MAKPTPKQDPKPAGRTAAPVPSGPPTDAYAPESSATGPAELRDVCLRITLVHGGITNVPTPVAIGARYDGLSFAGPTAAFDRLLDSWMTRAVDLGIIGSALGLLFPINVEQYHKRGLIKAENLILAGMGEPGRFAQDSLQFLMSNVVVTVKAMGHSQFATTLIGTRRNELSTSDAIRGFLQGIHDGYDRLRAIARDVKRDREALQRLIAQPLEVLLVVADSKKHDDIKRELAWVAGVNPIPGLKLSIGDDLEVDPDPKDDSISPGTDPDGRVNYLRMTRARAASSLRSAMPVAQPDTGPRIAFDPFPAEVFRFSALSELAVIPEREQEVNAVLLRDAADRLTKDQNKDIDHKRLGVYFADTVVPEDFRKLTESPASLTLEVDETTASYPWEMIAHRRFERTSFMSQSTAVSRQFRSLLSPPPTSPPALNRKLKVLVIADPGSGVLGLAGARLEGLAVVEVLEKASVAWGGQCEIKVKVRIGPTRDRQVDRIVEILRSKTCVESAEPCDPLDLAMLIVGEQHDVIHYAGHGVSDPSTGQTGWVFAPDCILSPREIFRVRQVPRLVFANACFSAVTSDHGEMRRQMAGLAQAYFARGIPNFIGAGWTVDDSCAEVCAQWFYASLMGLASPDAAEVNGGPSTIGEALKLARGKVFDHRPESPSWGAYQHYGNAGDRVIVPQHATVAGALKREPNGKVPPGAAAATGGPPPPSPTAGQAAMTATQQSPEALEPEADPNLVYVNGIDFETGRYAVAPRSIDDIAKRVLKRPGLDSLAAVHKQQPRAFGVPFGVDLEKPEEAGWGIVFHEDTPQDIRQALEPLIAHRRKQIEARLVRVDLDYRKGEQTRTWYQRFRISAGSVDPETMPFYLLLIGGPELIPFEFQYLLGVDYGVGRLAFDTAAEYEQYVRSLISYESGATVPNAREITYWGTRHANDPATNLSASLLIDPLANGFAAATGALRKAIHLEVGYERKLSVADDATKANLLEVLHGKTPPSVLFTASHGMQMRSGQAAQAATQGALLCQDWAGFGSVKPDHILAAADIGDDANVNGLVAFIFACFGAGTPDADQFLTDLSQADIVPPLAPKPFMSALPRRLLTHPNGSAIAVIGHIDRAWAFSIQAPKVAEPQILPFRNSLGFIMKGSPIGFSLCGQFGARFSAQSALLASATSPTTPPALRPTDRELVAAWIERNDSQNYVLLGDPAARIRKHAVT